MSTMAEAVGHLLKAGLLDLLSGVGDFVFFTMIFDYLDTAIKDFRDALLNNRMIPLFFASGITILTTWIMLQGYRIMTGQSRDSLMVLVVNSLRAVLIIGVASGMAFGGQQVYVTFTNGLSTAINGLVTGDSGSVESEIDKNLAAMSIALTAVDSLKVTEDLSLEDNKDRAKMFIGLGTAGPAVTGGALLLLNKIAMALFIGFGPFFIMCLLFDQTKQLFSKWLFYGVGTMFSLAVLSFMVSVSMRMVLAVTGAAWVSNTGLALAGMDTASMNSAALQQGGMGLILTILMVSAPPMAAAFFQGVLGQFSSYNQMAGTQAGGNKMDPQGRPLNTPSQSESSNKISGDGEPVKLQGLHQYSGGSDGPSPDLSMPRTADQSQRGVAN